MKKISIQPRIIISTTLVLLQLFSVATASGQTNTWNGSSNNNWNTASTSRTVTVNPLPTPATTYFLGDSLF